MAKGKAKGSGNKWVQKLDLHEGALTAKAKAAGKSPMAFASEHAHDSGKTGKQARLALVFQKMNHSKGSKKGGK